MDKDRRDKYTYPAIFDPCEEGGYCVTFPDLHGCITGVLDSIEVPPGGFVKLVEVDLAPVREEMRNKANK